MRTAGRVSYVVEKVGTFTVGYAAHGYPRQRDGERVDVFMGLRPEESFSAWRRRVDEAPVVNGVVLGGYVSVDPVEAGEFVAPESAESPEWERSSQWCRVRRGGGEFGEVPDRTRSRTAFIVVTLVFDYLGRGDAADLLLAHQVASPRSPSSIASGSYTCRALRADAGVPETTGQRLELASRLQ